MTMAVDQSYLQYPWRRPGMDHDRYDWSILPRRKPARSCWMSSSPMVCFPYMVTTHMFLICSWSPRRLRESTGNGLGSARMAPR